MVMDYVAEWRMKLLGGWVSGRVVVGWMGGSRLDG